MDLPVSVPDAVLGGKVRVPTPEGEVNLNIAAGTSSGKVMRLKGKGWTRRDGSRGDLLATVDSGMIPKLEACIRAVEHGVPQAHVVDGRQPHSMLLELFTNEGFGTMILPDESTPDESEGSPS